MAEINPSLLLQNHNPRYLRAALDPQSLIISQNPHLLRLTTESFALERGPRFDEYSDLRERKLRMKRLPESEREAPNRPAVLTPQKKQVKFSSDLGTPPRRSKLPSALTQSVPDFSLAIRKENRKPASMLTPVAERSPSPGTWKGGRGYGKAGGGSKSANSTEKRSGGGLAARKSYASMDELKKLGVAAGKEINGGKIGNKAVLGSRLF